MGHNNIEEQGATMGGENWRGKPPDQGRDIRPTGLLQSNLVDNDQNLAPSKKTPKHHSHWKIIGPTGK